MSDFTSKSSCCYKTFMGSSIATKKQIAKSWSECLGASAIPVVGKKPNLSGGWKHTTEDAQVYGSPQNWTHATGFGVVPVRGSDLHILDVDCPAFLKLLFAKLPRLSSSLRVERGGHQHIYLRMEGLKQSILSKKQPGLGEIASLRGHGAYVVGPYSQHTASGGHYLPILDADLPKPEAYGEVWDEWSTTQDWDERDLEYDTEDDPYRIDDLVYYQGKYICVEDIQDTFEQDAKDWYTLSENAEEESIEASHQKALEIQVITLEQKERILLLELLEFSPNKTKRTNHQTTSQKREPGKEAQESNILQEKEQKPSKQDTKIQKQGYSGSIESCQPRAIASGGLIQEETRQEIFKALQQQGFTRKRKGCWQGSCLFAHSHHKGGVDRNPSAVCYEDSGVYHCFVCGTRSPRELAQTLGIMYQAQETEDTGYMYSGLLGQKEKGKDQILCELNITTYLFSKEYSKAARLFTLLWDLSRRNHGQSHFNRKYLINIYRGYGWSVSKLDTDLRQSLKAGVITKDKNGSYRRVALRRLKEKYGLFDKVFGSVWLNRKIVTGKLSDFRQEIVLSVQYFLPKGLASETLAKGSGVSRRTLYRYENRSGIQREQRIKTEALARATLPWMDLVRCYDSNGRFTETLTPLDKRREATQQQVRRAGKWQGAIGVRQYPSIRHLPNRL